MTGFKLYLVTDSNACGGAEGLLKAVESALKGGVRAVQLREKELSAGELFALAVKMRSLTTRYGAKLFINDRLDVALAASADGIHLGQNSFSAREARPFLREAMMIGVSTHSLDEAKKASDDRADLITFGPIYKTPSKLKYGEPLGIASLKDVATKINIPIFAIGGIKDGSLGEVFRAGASGVAVISRILGAKDIEEETRAFVEAINKEEGRSHD